MEGSPLWRRITRNWRPCLPLVDGTRAVQDSVPSSLIPQEGKLSSGQFKIILLFLPGTYNVRLRCFAWEYVRQFALIYSFIKQIEKQKIQRSLLMRKIHKMDFGCKIFLNLINLPHSAHSAKGENDCSALWLQQSNLGPIWVWLLAFLYNNRRCSICIETGPRWCTSCQSFQGNSDLVKVKLWNNCHFYQGRIWLFC